MRFRLASAAVLAAVLAAPVSAQDFQRPDDWRVRFDQPDASEDQLEMFVSMPPGWHVTSGPAAIYWDPDNEASGSYRIEMEVFLFDPGERREAFGVFIGGRDLDGPEQAYAYFLIRNGGQFIVKERAGAEAPTIEPWTSHDAILSYADRGDDTSVLNVLTVEVDGGTLRFLVNDQEVWSGPRTGLPVDGMYGFRVNHGLNLHISRLEVAPLD
ncbi:MAG: hypothetical protein WD101_03340 [Gemmatimonadota bacterium]